MLCRTPKFIPTLLVSSLSCILLSACGIDDKPDLSWKPAKAEVDTSTNDPEISLVNLSFDPSEKDGELHYVVTVKDINTLKDKTVTVKYQLTENGSQEGVADLLKDPSQQSGTITLNSEKPQIDLKIPLKADGQATESRKITVTLSEPTGGAKLSDTTAESTVKNADLGLKITNTTAIKGNAESRLNFTVSTSPKQKVSKDTKVFFEVVDGTAKAGVDYKAPKNNFVIIKKGQDSVNIPITLIGSSPETSKNFSINLLTDSQLPLFKGQSSGTATISSYTPEQAKRTILNDTGVDYSGQTVGNDKDCVAKNGQDCNLGRDSTAKDDVDGVGGFSFTKLDNKGKALSADAKDWRCVKDNVTGLIWERKTFAEDSAKKDFQDAKHEYGYYDSQTGMGIKDTGKDVGKDDCGLAGDVCSTEQYIINANAHNLCGLTNWRVPTRFEVFNIINLSKKDSKEVFHNNWLFANPEHIPSNIWTSSPAVEKTQDGSYQFNRIWTVFSEGSLNKEDPSSKWSGAGIVLVSNGDMTQP